MKIVSRKDAIAQGLTRYFTGEPCANGHIAERYTKKSGCVICKLEKNREQASLYPEKQQGYSKKSYEANREKRLSRMKEYARENADKIQEYHAAYYLKNKVEANQKSRSWYIKNRQKMLDLGRSRYVANRLAILARMRTRYASNPELVVSRVKKWRKDNPFKYKAQTQNRRARIGSDKLSFDIVERLYVLQRGRCACCGKNLGRTFHLDHIMPLALGGRNIDENVQLLTQRCNNQKHARHPVDFMQLRGFLV